MIQTPFRLNIKDPGRLKLNWFSPVPPLPTSIADYTARVIPELSQFAEITVWTEQAAYNPEITQSATIKTYDLAHFPWPDLDDADLNIYQIGNSEAFHTAIWQVSQRCPGLVVLHDLKLQDLFVVMFRDRFQDQATYLRLMSYYYGKAGADLAASMCQGQMALESIVETCPLTELAIAGATGVIVHHSIAAQQLASHTSIPVHYLPLCYSFATPADPVPRRSVQPPYRLITFGHLGRNRRLEQVLKALQSLPQRQDFRWDIYGTVPSAAALQRHIRQLGLEASVHLHGFVSDHTLHEALSQADLAINLRYPSMGEASQSQLWIWSYALPSLVTDTAWYRSLPSDTVAFVPPASEISTIQTHLQAFHADPQVFMQMGQQGRALLEAEHSPAAYAAKLFEIICQSMSQPYRVFSNHTVRHYFAEKVEREFPEISQNLWLDPTFSGTAKAIRFLTS